MGFASIQKQIIHKGYQGRGPGGQGVNRRKDWVEDPECAAESLRRSPGGGGAQVEGTIRGHRQLRDRRSSVRGTGSGRDQAPGCVPQVHPGTAGDTAKAREKHTRYAVSEQNALKHHQH